MMSGDFDKGSPTTGIDFVEAERLTIDFIETKFQDFINYVNQVIKDAASKGRWEVELNLWSRGVWRSRAVMHGNKSATQIQIGPSASVAHDYFKKLGFDVYFQNNRKDSIKINWSRQNGGQIHE